MTRTYHVFFNLIALFLIVYSGVDIFYKSIQTKLTNIPVVGRATVFPQKKASTSSKSSSTGYGVISDRNIFGSVEKNPGEINSKPDISPENLEPTKLKIVLLGTVTGDSKNAYAVIESTDKRKQDLYREGDTIEEAVLKKIYRGKIILTFNGRDEVLSMEDDSTGKGSSDKKRRNDRDINSPVSPESNVVVNRDDLKGSMSDISRLMTNVRIRPYVKDGKPEGLAVSSIKPGSIFEKLGLKNGDVVTSVNDKEIKSPDDLFNLYSNLKTAQSLSVTINRNGSSSVVNYSFR